MLPTIWRPWKEGCCFNSNPDNTDNGHHKTTVSKEVRRLLLNCYEYFCVLHSANYGAMA